MKKGEEQEKVVRTTVWSPGAGCHGGCGVKLIVKNGRLVKVEGGAESVLFCQGTGRDVGGPISFLAYAYGSPNWVQLGLAAQSCYTPRLAAMFATMGDYGVLDAGQFDEKRYDAPEWSPRT